MTNETHKYERIKAILEQKIKELNLEEELRAYMKGYNDRIIQDGDGFQTLLFNLGATLAEYLEPGTSAIDDFEITRTEASLADLNDDFGQEALEILIKLAEIEISLASEGIFKEDFINALW